MAEEEVLFGVTQETDTDMDTMLEADSEKYLIFQSDGILFGVNADYVVEILTETSVTLIPLLPRHISGVINMRGLLVPIIDFRRMLNQNEAANTCTIVLKEGEAQIGILVDNVEQMVDVERKAILPVPYQSGQNIPGIVSGMHSLPDGYGTMMVLDCAYLFHEQ